MAVAHINSRKLRLQVQNQVSQNSNLEKGRAHEVPPPTAFSYLHLMAAGGDKISFPQGCGPWEIAQASMGGLTPSESFKHKQKWT